MEQTFVDNLRERRDHGGHAVAFIAWTLAETSVGIMKERALRQRKSSPLFVMMWLMVVLFTRTFIGVLRTGPAMLAGHVAVVSRGSFSLLLRFALMIWIGWVWVMNVIDQMPCFLGASGC